MTVRNVQLLIWDHTQKRSSNRLLRFVLSCNESMCYNESSDW